jgi:hypothetical protein
MDQFQKLALTRNMSRFGGNFVSCLATAMRAADAINFDRVCAAFPEIVEKYSDFQEYVASDGWVEYWNDPFNQDGPEWILVGYGHLPDGVNASDPGVQETIDLSRKQNNLKSE